MDLNTLVLLSAASGRGPLERVLRRRGHALTACADLEEAVAAYRPERHALVVTEAPAVETDVAPLRRLRDVLDPHRSLLVAAVPPGDPGAFRAAVGAGADEVVDAGDEAALDGRLALLEQRARRLGRQAAEYRAQRRQAEAARAAVQRYLDVAGGLFVEIDRDGRVALINREGCRLLGRPEGEVVGADWFERFIPPPQRERVRAIHHAFVEGDAEAPERAEHDVLTSGGERRRIAWHNAALRDERGRIVGTLSSGQDLTERHHAASALEASQARARAILETTVDAVITIDARGTIESFNRAATRIFGYEAGEAIGQDVALLMPEPYRAEHDGYLEAYHATGRRRIIGIGREVVGRHKDGTAFPIDLAVSEVDLDGRRVFTGVIRDLTEQKRLEREVVEISAQERQRLGQELHDGLGSHLTGVALSCRALARRLEKGKPVAKGDIGEIARLVQEGAEQARMLSRGLNPIALTDQGLAAALAELAATVQKLSGVACLFEDGEDVPPQDSETTLHLYRIAQEATNNAVKHARPRHVWIRLAREAHALRLTVRDDGVGLPPSLDAASGIGRRVMAYRAHQIGAAFALQDAPGGGALATVTLPLSPADRALGAAALARTR